MPFLTPFGRVLRDFRLERCLLLGDMADALGLGAAELSSIETGKRAIPTDMIDRLEKLYKLGTRWRWKLNEAFFRTDNSPEAIMRRNQEEAQL